MISLVVYTLLCDSVTYSK